MLPMTSRLVGTLSDGLLSIFRETLWFAPTIPFPPVFRVKQTIVLDFGLFGLLSHLPHIPNQDSLSFAIPGAIFAPFLVLIYF